MRRAILSLLGVCLFAVQLLSAAEMPDTFGEQVNGIQVAVNQPQGGALTVVLLNHGPETAQLEDGFVWVLLAETREKAYFTGKLSLGASAAALKPGERRELQLRLPDQQLYPYEKGTKVAAGYPQASGSKTVAVSDLPLSLRAQAIAYVKAGGERFSVKSKAIPIVVREQQQAASQPGDMAGLLEAFRRDAFAAQAAHDRAVKIGPAALPTLKAGLADGTMPDFGSMWMATAVVHIGGVDGTQMAADLVDDKREGVRDVVAYHGPAVKSDLLDQAILKKARSGADPLFTAWAGRGFGEHGREFPPELVDAAFESREPRARAEVAPLLARAGDGVRLARLCNDEHELVRVAAADAVARNAVTTPVVLKAMVASLEAPGESSRQRMVEALSKVLGKSWGYDPQAPQEQRDASISQIRREALALLRAK